jgi:hypothetical protein
MWLTDERRNLLGASSDGWALVLFLGREHYTERRKKYPPLTWRDLRGVLRQELSGAPPTLTAVSQIDGDHREVAFFEVRPGSANHLSRALFVVPESVAVAGALTGNGAARVERDGFTYFVTSSGMSQPAGGAVADVQIFAIAAGLDAEAGTISLGRVETLEHVLRGVRRLSPFAWAQFHRPLRGSGPGIRWQLIGKLLGAALLVYLTAVSGYLGFSINTREAEMVALGPDVETLLKVQQELDRLDAERGSLIDVLAERHYSYIVWRFVATAWSKGASVSDVRLADDQLTIQGAAPSSTDVLAAIASIPQAKDARFTAPVRSGADGGEDFSISVTIWQVADHG